jgi:hypothetical protein
MQEIFEAARLTAGASLERCFPSEDHLGLLINRCAVEKPNDL